MNIGEQTCANSCERVAYQIEIKRLTKERDEAREEAERFCADADTAGEVLSIASIEIDRLNDEVERLREDAERYRWLLEHGDVSWFGTGFCITVDPCAYGADQTIDDAIDAAMREGE